MSNVRVLTGGLVVIVLALAGGTGYLIYERIQGEVGGSVKATHAEVQEIRETQKEDRKSILANADQIRLNKNDISANRKAIAANTAEIGILGESQKQLRKDMEAGDQQAKELHDHQQKKIDELVESSKELADSISKLEKANAEIRRSLESQGERIEEQERRLDELQAQDGKQDQEIAALKAELAELKKLLGVDDTKKPSN